LKPEELRARFMTAETSAEETAVFDAAVAELRRIDELARKAGLKTVNFPFDVKQLRNRFLNASSPVDLAISFDSIVFEIEQLAQRLPAAAAKDLIAAGQSLPQTQNPEELKRYIEAVAGERDLYRNKVEEAITEHGKLKRLLEELTRDRVSSLTQVVAVSKTTDELKQEITQLRSQPAKERQELERLSSNHEQMKRVALTTQRERDQLKQQTRQLSEEIEQFHTLIGQLSQKHHTVTSEQEKLLDENFTLKNGMFKLALEQLEGLEGRLAQMKKRKN
jgi:chromosome segregation ATPase